MVTVNSHLWGGGSGGGMKKEARAFVLTSCYSLSLQYTKSPLCAILRDFFRGTAVESLGKIVLISLFRLSVKFAGMGQSPI